MVDYCSGDRIILQRYYPALPDNMDIDRVFDNAIRADLLIHILKDFYSTGNLP